MWIKRLCVAMIIAGVGSCAGDNSRVVTPGAGTQVLQTLPGIDAFVVPVLVNDSGPYHFLIDTGATVSAVFEPLHSDLTLPTPEGRADALIRGIVSTVRRPFARLETLQVGAFTHHQLDVVVLPEGGIADRVDGIIGMDILSQYAFGYDYRFGTVTLTPSEAFDDKELQRWDSVPLITNPYGERDFGLHFVWGVVSGERLPILLDTGTDPSIINWSASSFSRVLRTLRQELRAQSAVEGVNDIALPRVRASMPTIQLNEHAWRTPRLLVLDLEPLEILGGESGAPLIIMGSDMLAERRFVIDFAGNQMYISSRTNPDPAPERDEPRGLAKGSRF